MYNLLFLVLLILVYIYSQKMTNYVFLLSHIYRLLVMN